MSDILQQIIARKRTELNLARLRSPYREQEELAAALPPCRPFVTALRRLVELECPAVIAEIKRASPSKGVLREPFYPDAIARQYAQHGAACLSVLTEQYYFKGAVPDLQQARAACELPVLRKDFIFDPYQVVETRALGADALLLIVAALDFGLMRELAWLAHGLGLAVLVEVHDERELELALALDTPLVGINNRNLRTFETRLETTLRLCREVPPGRIVITESGIARPADVQRISAAGVWGFLIGEVLMCAADPGVALASLLKTPEYTFGYSIDSPNDGKIAG